MNRNLLSVLFVILLFSVISSAQNQTENLLEKTELSFTLSADADSPDVGFENPNNPIRSGCATD